MQLTNFIESAGAIGERRIQTENGSNTYNAGVIVLVYACVYVCICVCLVYVCTMPCRPWSV